MAKLSKAPVNESTLYILLLMFFDLLLGQVIRFNTAIVLMILIGWSFVYVVKVNQLPGVSRVFKALNWLIMLFTIYGVLLVFSNERLLFQGGEVYINTHYLLSIYQSLLPLYAFYYFSRTGQLTAMQLRKFIPVWFLLAIIIFLQTQSEMRLLNEDDEAEVTNGSAYLLLSLIPAVALYKKRLFQYIILGLVVFFVAYGVKRGAIAVLFLSVLYYFYIYRKTTRKKFNIRSLLITLILLYAIGYFFYSFYLSSDYFQYRWTQTIEGDSSGRSLIYGDFWYYFLNQDSILGMLIGNGACATIRIKNIFAHNDWLEILINQGILGVTIFASFCYQLLKSWKKARYDTTLYLGIGLFVIFFLSKTLFSMSYNNLPYYSAAIFAFLLAKSDTDQQIENNGR